MFVTELLEALGFKIGLDWDDELMVEPPQAIDLGSACSWIAGHKRQIKKEVASKAQYEKYILVGGPRAGDRHGHAHGSPPMLFHIKHGQWAVYVVQKDCRAIFYGYASSQEKARQLGSTGKHPAWADRK